MPDILDKFDNSVRSVSQAIYDQWIVQTDRFAPAGSAPATEPPAPQAAPSTASDLVGRGLEAGEPLAQHVPDAPAATPQAVQPERPPPSVTPEPRPDAPVDQPPPATET